MTIIRLTTLCACIIAPLGLCFSPAAPPRFDVFCEQIVGSWQTDKAAQSSVEEVMRSCGGAVQGIKECDDDDFYLNRADDGFVFFDCGSYSHGPIDLNDDDDMCFRTSLSVSRARVFLTFGGTAPTAAARVFPKTKFGADAVQNAVVPLPVSTSKTEYDVSSQLQCRMSSPISQWMMQRAKWEKQQSNDDTFLLEGPNQAWVEQHTNDNGSILFSSGISCPESGYVKEVIRSYNENKRLERVVLRKGRMQ